MAEKKNETQAPRIIKAGGAKGEAILAAMKKTPDASRAGIAERVGCTTGRVGEVVRYLAAYGTPEEQKIVAPFLAKPKGEKKAPTKKAATTKKAAPAAKKTTPAKTRTRKAATATTAAV